MPSGQVKEYEIEHFNNYGENKDFDAFDERGYGRIINELLKNLSEPYTNLKAIDLGCATGCFTIRIADLGIKIKGIDISENCIKYALKKNSNIQFEVGDIENLNVSDEEFDVVVLFGVMHHFPELTDAINESWRILKKGGILFTYDPHMNNPFYWLYRHKKSPFRSTKGITENERPLTKGQVKSALNKFKFIDSQIYCISGVTLSSKSAKYKGVIKRLIGLFNLIERLTDFYPLNNMLGASIISVSKKG